MIAATPFPNAMPERAGQPALAREALPLRGAQVPAVQRALSLLDRLASRREPMSLARLSAELALPKSSVHGLCNTLVNAGYLWRQDDGAFRLGPSVMALAEAFVASTSVAQEFNALWQDRVAAPEDTVILSVLSGAEVVYVGVRNGTRPLGLAFTVGMRLPAYLAATGKAQLAHEPLETLRGALGPGPFAPMVSRQPLSLAALEADLAATRARGYSVDDEGVREGVVCFGAAVLGAHGQAVAGVGVCTHKETLGRSRGAAGPDAERHRNAVLELAHLLSLRLGGVSPSTRVSA